MTRWDLHVQEWSNCQRCFLHERRRNTCLARGDIPCDVLLCGMAPGPNEDLSGEVFCGPAGQLLDSELEPKGMIQRALVDLPGPPPRFLFSNLVACFPINDDGSGYTDPEDECVEVCKPRLIDLVEIAQPKLIVCVGKLVGEWFDPGFKHSHKFKQGRVPLVQITHPAGILKAPLAARSLLVKRAVVTLRDAFESLVSRPT